jgi:hypothetical protein
MFQWMFAILLLVDYLAVRCLSPHPTSAAQLAYLWLIFGSTITAWSLGLKVFRLTRGHSSVLDHLFSVMAANSIVFAACSSAVHFSGYRTAFLSNLYEFGELCVFRLNVAAAITIPLSFLLLLSKPGWKALRSFAVCQIFSWLGILLQFDAQQETYQDFVHCLMLTPWCCYGLLTGGVVLDMFRSETEPTQTALPT